MLRVYISADIEGVVTATKWDQTDRNCAPWHATAAEMTREVKAACEGAIEGGADFILVKDAHDGGVNIDINELPTCCELIRSGCGHPYTMAYGVQEGFDAAFFIGYHSAASRCGNPLSHTFSQAPYQVFLNGKLASEFTLFSLVANLEGAAPVLLTGDQMLCDDNQGAYPLLKTVAVKSGLGRMTRSIHPEIACRRIKEAAREAVSQDLSKGLIEMPERFVLEIAYKEHVDAVEMSYFPGFEMTGDTTIRMETNNYVDVVRAVKWVL